MGLERVDLFVGVVVEHPELVVIAACDEPLLAGDEASTPHRDFGDLKGLEDGAGVDVVDLHGPVVETGEQPGLGRVEIDVLDPIGPVEELALRWCMSA
jgi:hypothetical protein